MFKQNKEVKIDCEEWNRSSLNITNWSREREISCPNDQESSLTKAKQ